jgi:hypothetical protein
MCSISISILHIEFEVKQKNVNSNEEKLPTHHDSVNSHGDGPSSVQVTYLFFLIF